MSSARGYIEQGPLAIQLLCYAALCHWYAGDCEPDAAVRIVISAIRRTEQRLTKGAQ
jgi:hypothetical protein